MPEALIWGASGGIGQALVRTLKANNWTVYGAARKDDLIPDEADLALHFTADDLYSIQSCAMQIAQRTQALDLVIYAAGGTQANLLHKLEPEAFQAVMSANLTGAFLTAQASLDLIRRDGHMMFISAYLEKINLPRMGAYAAAKAGLDAMASILQKENRKLKISLVRPPAVTTSFWKNAPFRMPDYAIDPAEVARAMLGHYEHGQSGDLEIKTDEGISV